VELLLDLVRLGVRYEYAAAAAAAAAAAPWNCVGQPRCFALHLPQSGVQDAPCEHRLCDHSRSILGYIDQRSPDAFPAGKRCGRQAMYSRVVLRGRVPLGCPRFSRLSGGMRAAADHSDTHRHVYERDWQCQHQRFAARFVLHRKEARHIKGLPSDSRMPLPVACGRAHMPRNVWDV
jgi:hypothetical protein